MVTCPGTSIVMLLQGASFVCPPRSQLGGGCFSGSIGLCLSSVGKAWNSESVIEKLAMAFSFRAVRERPFLDRLLASLSRISNWRNSTDPSGLSGNQNQGA